jgi:hypothetical protein
MSHFWRVHGGKCAIANDERPHFLHKHKEKKEGEGKGDSLSETLSEGVDMRQ